MRKTIQLCALVLLITHNIIAQSTTQTNLQAGIQNRFLGYTNNFQLLFKTSDISRSKINHNVSYQVNGFTDVRNGYMLLSPLQNGGRDFILFPLF